jgi:hypothetical protein
MVIQEGRTEGRVQEGSDKNVSSEMNEMVDTTDFDRIPLQPPQIEIKLRSPEERGFKRVVSNYAFGVGERLEFSVGYGVIKAGTAVMEYQRSSRSTAGNAII